MAKRTLIFFIMFIFVVIAASGCGKERPDVSLSIWTSAEEKEIMTDMIEAFKEEYADETDFDNFVVTISEEDETTCRGNTPPSRSLIIPNRS